MAAVGVLAWWSALATTVRAQEAPPIDLHAPVRVWTHAYNGPERFVGRATAPDSSTLHVLTDRGLVVLPLVAIDSVQVRRTIRPSKAGKYAAIGALLGGTMCGLAAYSSADKDGWENLAGAVGAAAGLVAGAILGGVVGALNKQEGWMTVRPPFRLAALPHGLAGGHLQFRVGVAVR